MLALPACLGLLHGGATADNRQMPTESTSKAVVTRHLTLNVRHFHPGLFASNPSWTFKSTLDDVYYAAGISFPDNGTLTKIVLSGKFLHNATNDAEKVAVRLFKINELNRQLVGSVQSDYIASSPGYRSIILNTSKPITSSSPYYVILFMPGVGADKYEIASVRFVYETGTP
jgi:hypothetical protein